MRGQGTTTQQILNAPKDALFIWMHGDTYYPKGLARKLGREDLEIVGPDFLDWKKWRGRIFTGVVVDHAAELTDRQHEALTEILCYKIQTDKT